MGLQALPHVTSMFQFYVADNKLSLPALSAERRTIFLGGAFQYRELCVAHYDGGASLRP